MDNPKDIARNYIFGWFLLDTLAITPFDKLTPSEDDESTSGNANQLVRIAKLGRMQKLIKLTRLIRIIKVVKNQKSMLQQIKNILGAGFERLCFFILASLMVCHIFACLWVFFSQMFDEEVTWMSGDVEEMTAEQ